MKLPLLMRVGWHGEKGRLNTLLTPRPGRIPALARDLAEAVWTIEKFLERTTLIVHIGRKSFVVLRGHGPLGRRRASRRVDLG